MPERMTHNSELRTQNSERLWLWAFAGVALVHLFGILSGREIFALWTKPLLMPALAAWFWTATQGTSGWLRKAVLLALVCCTAGDVLLMGAGENCFIFGLVAFLAGHLFYLSGFLSKASFSRGYVAERPGWVLPFLAYLLGFLLFLWPHLPEGLRVPVAVYAAVILTMCLSVFNLKNVLAAAIWQWALTGAILFACSDSLLAIAKFCKPFPGDHLAILLTYIFGQFLLVRSAAAAIVRPS